MEKDLPRLQKALAAAGVASRRACETLIAEGHVQVNGAVIREMGFKVNPESDVILVDGVPVPLQAKAKPLYIMLHKPVGYTSTASDPHAEHTVLELLTQIEERVYPVGRLDVDSEGLLLLTNDGEFANRATHPRYHVPKLYRVRARGFVGRAAATRLAEGVELEDGITAASEVSFIEYDSASQSTIIEITLFEGRNRQVRRMFDLIGHPVRQLTRIGFGNLRLGGLNVGTWRKLRPEEVESLLALAQPTPTPPKIARRVKPSGPYRPRNAGNQARAAENHAGAPPATSRPDYAPPTVPHPNNAPPFPSRPDIAPPAAPRRPFAPSFAQKPPQREAGMRNEGRQDYGRRDDDKRGENRPALAPRPENKPLPASRPAYPAAPNGRPRPGAKPYDSRAPRPETSDYARPLSQAARAATPFEKKISKLPPRPDTRPAAPGSVERKPENKFGNNADGRPAPKRKFAPSAPPAPAPDGSTNNAAGRKAGVPYQPRPKTGHRAFGRARP